METNNWQAQFDKIFDPTSSSNQPPDIRGFIQSLLDQQKSELLEKITLKEKTINWYPEGIEPRGANPSEFAGYNQAVSDLEVLKANLTPPIEGKDETPSEEEN
jgi:hypothetical protein